MQATVISYVVSESLKSHDTSLMNGLNLILSFSLSSLYFFPLIFPRLFLFHHILSDLLPRSHVYRVNTFWIFTHQSTPQIKFEPALHIQFPRICCVYCSSNLHCQVRNGNYNVARMSVDMQFHTEIIILNEIG